LFNANSANPLKEIVASMWINILAEKLKIA